MTRKKTAPPQSVPTARYGDLAGEIATATQVFGELVEHSRANRCTLLLHSNTGITTLELDNGPLLEGIREVFAREAGKISGNMKRRFNITLEHDDVL